jgi:hypothetical protein
VAEDIIIRAHPGEGLREVRAACAKAKVLAGASVEQLFPGSVRAGDGVVAAPDLPAFFRIVPHDGTPPGHEEIAAGLKEAIADVWISPEPRNTGLPASTFAAGSAEAVEKPPPTPDFFADQRYLGPVEQGGVGAEEVWSKRGGRGAGIAIIDVEREWCPGHEDLLIDEFLIDGSPSGDVSERNHGTSVIGVLAARHDRHGTRGLCPEATVNGMSIEGEGRTVATAIWQAANRLRPGDIMLLEMQAPGPGAGPDPQKGWLPIEWWPAERAAIQFAVNRGVIVVAAAGNGDVDFDDPRYAAPPPGFRGEWRNAFRDDLSGAILVGAGTPPHWKPPKGWTGGPDRSRMSFSNYGERVDTQAWGYDVTTTGGLGGQWDDFFNVPQETRWYTNRFSGTSSAAAIVAGVLGCVQGVLRAAGRTPLEPLEAREFLRTGGAAQRKAPDRPVSQRIGPRVGLPDLLERAMAGPRRPRRFTAPRGAGSTPRPPRPSRLTAPRAAGSTPMSAPSTVYNLYFGGGAQPVLQIDPRRFTVSPPMPKDAVNLTQVKGPGAFVVPTGEGEVVVIHLDLGGAGVPPVAVDASQLNGDVHPATADVDLTHVKGPSLAVPAGAGQVRVMELPVDG